MEKDKTRPQYPRRGGYCLTFSFSLPWFPLHSNNRPVDQTVTKGLSSSSKFSGSCVPTLQTLPWLSVSCPSPVVSLVPSGHSFHSLHVRISPLFPSSPPSGGGPKGPGLRPVRTGEERMGGERDRNDNMISGSKFQDS